MKNVEMNGTAYCLLESCVQVVEPNRCALRDHPVLGVRGLSDVVTYKRLNGILVRFTLRDPSRVFAPQ
jgi:hypothetical protein